MSSASLGRPILYKTNYAQMSNNLFFLAIFLIRSLSTFAFVTLKFILIDYGSELLLLCIKKIQSRWLGNLVRMPLGAFYWKSSKHSQLLGAF